MRKLTIALAAAILILAVPAWAQDDEDEDDGGGSGFDRTGFYGSVSATYAVENISGQKVLLDNEKTTTDFRNAWGGNFRLGYRANPVLGVEFEWEGFKSFNDSSGTRVDIEGWVGTLNARANVPLGRIQPYLLFGAGMMQARTDGKGTNGQTNEAFTLRGGGGFDTYITDNIVFTSDVSYVLPLYQHEGIDYIAISFGLGYRF